LPSKVIKETKENVFCEMIKGKSILIKSTSSSKTREFDAIGAFLEISRFLAFEIEINIFLTKIFAGTFLIIFIF
jgi:hypothetical protein